MAIGCHVARCAHCGKQWLVGDCVPSVCGECEEKGHRGMFLDCPACCRDHDERMERIRNAKADEAAGGE